VFADCSNITCRVPENKLHRIAVNLDIRGISLEDSWDVVLWIMVSTEHIEEASLSTGAVPNHDQFLVKSHRGHDEMMERGVLLC